MALEVTTAANGQAAPNGVPHVEPAAEPAPEVRPADGVKIDPEQLRLVARTSRENRELKAKLAAYEAKAAEPAKPPELPPEIAARAARVEGIEKQVKEGGPAGVLKVLADLGLTYETITAAVLASNQDELPPETKEALEIARALKARADAEDKEKAERAKKDEADAIEKQKTASVELHKQAISWVKETAEKIGDDMDASRWPLVVGKGEYDGLTTQLEQAIVSFVSEENDKLAKAGKPRDFQVTQEQADEMLTKLLDRAERWYRFEASEDESGQMPSTGVRKYGSGGVETRQTEEPHRTAPEERRPRPTIGSERGPTMSLTPARKQLSAADAKRKLLANYRE